jgi:hypothetical protein
MKHVSLDAVDEPIRLFALGLLLDPAGTVLEAEGRPLAVVVPFNPSGADEAWTDDKNRRRCELIDRQCIVGLSIPEAVELARLQQGMMLHRDHVAPLPLEHVRQLHQELMEKAGRAAF